MNSFFKGQPHKPLGFPQVLLKETGKQIEVVEEIYDAIDTTTEKLLDNDDNDNEDEDNVVELIEPVSELQEISNNESEESQ